MGETPLYPVTLVLEGKPCLVVGGGPVAARKIRGLLHCGAVVTVVAPQVLPEITDADVSIERRPYRSGEVSAYRLVIAATGHHEVNRQVYEEAEAAGVLVNSADDPESCSFMLPSVVRHDPVTVAVSTSGASPALAVWLRSLLSGFVGPEHADLAKLLAEARDCLHRSGRSSEAVPWGKLLDEELPSLVREGRLDEARELLSRVAGVQLSRTR